MTLIYSLLGAGALCVAAWLRNWAKDRGGALGWYHWVGVAVIALWTLFVVAWIGTSIGEGYGRAAGIGALIWGGLDVVLFILVRLWIVKSVGKKSGAPLAKAKAA